MTRVVAVLDVAWGRGGVSFKINPRNRSGARLYRLLGHDDLLVTNACPGLVRTPAGRGLPNPDYLNTNLQNLMPFGLLLVCGKVAQETLRQCRNKIDVPTILMPHPAARDWTKRGLNIAAARIRDAEARRTPCTILNTSGEYE